MFNIFDNSTAEQDFEYILYYRGSSVLRNGVPVRALISNTNLEQHYDDKKITTLEELNRGDVIDYDGKTFMVISGVCPLFCVNPLEAELT